MQSKDELLRAAQREVAFRRQRAVTLANENEQRALNEIPGYADALVEVRQAALRAAKMAIVQKGTDAAERTLAESRAARAKANALLAQHGLTPADLEPQFSCPLCDDTGMEGGHICSCVRILQREMRRDEITRASALNISSFDAMETDRYPDTFDPMLGQTVRQYMAARLAELKSYAEGFSLKSSSLLLCGSAGLGKTHAALAIAGVVLDKGYDVIYISAQELFGHLDKVRFDRTDDFSQDSMMDAVLAADLLIVDDLGTEFLSPYVSSCFYTILNSRICRRQPTIYTTNITNTDAFESRYTEKIASRLTGSCEPVSFYGADIRQFVMD